MSNVSGGGNNVLDSWEEIDEIGLSTQLDQLKKEYNTSEENSDNYRKTIEKTENMPFHHQNGGGIPIMMVMRSPTDEEYGSNYTQTNKSSSSSTVKILRRPTQKTINDKKLNDNRPKQPIKTLQQREQEYAEARLRILGSAKNPEDELESNLPSKVVMKSSSPLSSQPPPPPAHPFQSTSADTISPVSASASMNNYNYHQARNMMMMTTGNTLTNNASIAPIGITAMSGGTSIFYNNDAFNTTTIPSSSSSAVVTTNPSASSSILLSPSSNFSYFSTNNSNNSCTSSYNLNNFEEYKPHYYNHNPHHHDNGNNSTMTTTTATTMIIRMPKGPDGTTGFHFNRR